MERSQTWLGCGAKLLKPVFGVTPKFVSGWVAVASIKEVVCGAATRI